MTHNSLRIAWDFDSIIWPTLEVYGHITGNPSFAYEQCLSWDHPIQWAGGLDHFLELDRQARTYEVMRSFQPLPGAIQTMLETQQRSAHGTLITARPDDGLQAVIRILDDNGYAPEVCVSRRSSEKVAYLLEHNIPVLAEDEPNTIRAAHEAGIHVASLRYPYNAAVIDELGIPHAASWTGLRPIIFKLLGLAE